MRSILWALILFLPSLAFAFPGNVAVVFYSSLTVPQEVKQAEPKTPANAIGSARFAFNPITNTLTYSISFAHLSSAPSMSHFHLGAAGSNGPVLQTICGSPAPALSGNCPAQSSSNLQGVWHLNAEQEKELFQGEIYVNIHTTLNPGGEIRGQLW